MTHAFFKALLFLASGAVIVACHHEQNIFKMGGLWKKLPLAYASFVVGGAALAALPILTAGFYPRTRSSGKPSPAAIPACCTLAWSVRS